MTESAAYLFAYNRNNCFRVGLAVFQGQKRTAVDKRFQLHVIFQRWSQRTGSIKMFPEGFSENTWNRTVLPGKFKQEFVLSGIFFALVQHFPYKIFRIVKEIR